ncbi:MULTISPECIES: cytochrome b/b6 domain-containing protein [unclassified Marinobacter]|uniref:cytochrome b/b6 domain-containing protein n=1 Tax=unclassified Marinobacter TaxID=83889 RepID=UPI0008DD48E0|nr:MULTISPECIES: cytochrome b/b6 domain-containing protein [unclassified Marinobacter]MBQ0832794.1 cytochrome b/b6 domain-containing protein [Marinobacter sp.]OHY80815.1 hypothetical protein BCA33_12895 [Marinobacter sp. AC-23]
MKNSKAHTRTLYRHGLPMRITHWANALCLFFLLLSGLQIFNAHPHLYWGSVSDFDSPWLSMGAHRTEAGEMVGHTRLFGWELNTTGVLGLSSDANGDPQVRGFPSWLTIPSGRWLAMGRNWHFFFAWLLVINASLFFVWAVASGHLKKLIPTREDWRSFGSSVISHIKLQHPAGEEATRYNILQKLAYLITIFGLGALIVITGLCMSPRMDTVMGGVLEVLGGRQSARSIHFLIACSFVLFVFVHLFEVVVTGPLNNLRSMITGNFRYQTDTPDKHEKESHHDG